MALLGSFGHLLLLFLPPFLLAAYPSPVCNVWSKTPSQLDICQDPSFDAAVSVSESQMLLFKGRHMWLLDILNYQVSLPQANCLLDSCLAPTSPSPSPQMDPPQSPPLYFVWNEHSNAHGHSQHLDRICVQGAGKICQFSVNLRPTANDIFQGSRLPSFRPFDGWNGHADSTDGSPCAANVNGRAIEIALGKKNFYRDSGPKRVWLYGRHFKVHVSYTPGQYDRQSVLFKTELFRRYSEVEEYGEEGSAPQQAQESEPGEKIQDVQTFAVLPTGELMILFADNFCIINYYDVECKRRSTRSLIGCTMPLYDVSSNQVYVSPDTRLPTTTTTTGNKTRHVEGRPESTSVGPSSGASTGAISDNGAGDVSRQPSTTAVPSSSSLSPLSPHEVVRNKNGSHVGESSSVSTLPTTKQHTTAPSPANALPEQTLSHSTATPTATPTWPVVSGDNNGTSFPDALTTSTLPSSLVPVPNGSNSSSPLSQQYDANYFIRKRDAFKRTSRHVHDEGDKWWAPVSIFIANYAHHLSIGCTFFFYGILYDAIWYSIATVGVIQLLALFVISACYSVRKIDYALLFYVYLSVLSPSLSTL